jgi:hypothetical protein
MFKSSSNQQNHARLCPAKNPKPAIILVATLSFIAFLSWKNLHAPLHVSPITATFGIFVCILLATTFTCLREKLIILFAIASLLVSATRDFFPSAFGQRIETAHYIKLTLWLLALLLSITMLVQSLRTKNPAT